MTVGPSRETRVVIDSSVVLPILLQREPETNPLLRLWQGNQVKPLANDETLAELRATLLGNSPTPKQLQAQRFVDLALRRYVPWCEFLPLQEIASAPKCRDPRDQKFIDLAIAGDAAFLITRDNDLLSMNDSFSFHILNDSDFLRNMNLAS